MPDKINHPEHYASGDMECIDAIQGMLGDGFAAYCRGNVLKYLWRYLKKGGSEDLHKARWYIDRLIDEVEAEEDLFEASSMTAREMIYGHSGTNDIVNSWFNDLEKTCTPLFIDEQDKEVFQSTQKRRNTLCINNDDE